MPTSPPSLVREKDLKPLPSDPSSPEGETPTGVSGPAWFTLYGRAAVAAVLLTGALVSGLVLLRRPEVLREVADLSLLRVYRTFVLNVVVPYARAFTVLLVAFQVVAALSVLGRGRVVTVALAAVVGFLIALIPALGSYNTMNVPFLMLVTLLLLRSYPETVLQQWRRRHPPLDSRKGRPATPARSWS